MLAKIGEKVEQNKAAQPNDVTTHVKLNRMSEMKLIQFKI